MIHYSFDVSRFIHQELIREAENAPLTCSIICRRESEIEDFALLLSCSERIIESSLVIRDQLVAAAEKRPSLPPRPERISDMDDSCSTCSITKQECDTSTSTSSSIPVESKAKHEELSEDHLVFLHSPSFPENESPADFDFDFELPLRWYKRAWSFILCIFGLLDILAYIEPTLRSYGTCAAAAAASNFAGFDGTVSGLLELEDTYEPSTSWFCSTWITFLNRLNDYNVVISFVFSVLWFKYSHSKAREEYYYKTRVQEDRIQLLSPTTSNKDEEGKEYTNRSARRKKGKVNPRNIFYRRIVSRMILLPVGFYIILYYFLRGLMRGKWLYRELMIAPVNETVFLTFQDPNEYVTIEISKAHAKMSTIFAILTYMKYRFLLATTFARAELGAYFKNSAIPQLRRKLVVNAARNPRNFIRQLKTVLKYVRWIKFIIPLIAKLNKLRGNAVSTLRKRRQVAIAKKQRLIYNFLWKKKSQAEKEEDAAILIQRVWRAHQN